jgi:hypothetical protein
VWVEWVRATSVSINNLVVQCRQQNKHVPMSEVSTDRQARHLIPVVSGQWTDSSVHCLTLFSRRAEVWPLPSSRALTFSIRALFNTPAVLDYARLRITTPSSAVARQMLCQVKGINAHSQRRRADARLLVLPWLLPFVGSWVSLMSRCSGTLLPVQTAVPARSLLPLAAAVET